MYISWKSKYKILQCLYILFCIDTIIFCILADGVAGALASPLLWTHVGAWKMKGVFRNILLTPYYFHLTCSIFLYFIYIFHFIGHMKWDGWSTSTRQCSLVIEASNIFIPKQINFDNFHHFVSPIILSHVPQVWSQTTKSGLDQRLCP